MLRRLFHCNRGSSIIDFAFALPVLATLMVGTLEMGQVLHASGALRHALGDGIRLAKVDPAASEADVLGVVREQLAGINPDGIKTLKFTRGTKNGASFGEVEISYEIQPVIPFVPTGALTLNESKSAYLPT